jgi:hypothetical protein
MNSVLIPFLQNFSEIKIHSSSRTGLCHVMSSVLIPFLQYFSEIKTHLPLDLGCTRISRLLSAYFA